MTATLTSSPRRAHPAEFERARDLLAAVGLPLAGVDQHFNRYWAIDTADGRLAGIAGTERYGSTWLLRSLAVDPAHHGRGLGDTLLASVLDEARRHGAEELRGACPDTATLMRLEVAP